MSTSPSRHIHLLIKFIFLFIARTANVFGSCTIPSVYYYYGSVFIFSYNRS